MEEVVRRPLFLAGCPKCIRICRTGKAGPSGLSQVQASMSVAQMDWRMPGKVRGAAAAKWVTQASGFMPLKTKTGTAKIKLAVEVENRLAPSVELLSN